MIDSSVQFAESAEENKTQNVNQCLKLKLGETTRAYIPGHPV